ncbi:MAG: hypothetical protein R3F49_21760 [Planctomycetota bacterium]
MSALAADRSAAHALNAPRAARALRSLKTLLTHELRELGPFALAVLLAGSTLLCVVRVAAGAGATEVGRLGRELPCLAPGLGTALFAVFAAEAFTLDAASGRARALAAAPIRHLPTALRALAVAAFGALVWCGALALEPIDALQSSRHLGWMRAVFIGTGLVTVLAAWTLRHSIGGSLVGIVAGWVPLGLLALHEGYAGASDAEALVHLALSEVVAATDLRWTIIAGSVASALLIGARGAITRSLVRRAAGAWAVLCLVLAPGVSPAARELAARLWPTFDAPATSVMAIATDGGDALHVQVNFEHVSRWNGQRRTWTTSWRVDTRSGARSRLTREAETSAEPSVPQQPSRLQTLNVSNDRLSPLYACTVERTDRRDPQCFRARSYAFSGPERTTLYYVDEAWMLQALTLADGTSRPVAAIEAGQMPRIGVSPDGRWVVSSVLRWQVGQRRSDNDGEGSPRLSRVHQLIDVQLGAVVQEFNAIWTAWRAGAEPLLVPRYKALAAPGSTSRYELIGPNGARALPFDPYAGELRDLDGDRWLFSTPGGGIAVHAADGALLRVLRIGQAPAEH